MRLDILCTDGSPLGVTMKDLWGEGRRGIGIGGSEYALLTMCEEWYKSGYDVCLYNNPAGESDFSPFEQKPVNAFDPNGSRDVIITFRSPNAKSIVAKGLRVWWSCDQYTIGDYRQFAPTQDKIVCISDFHKKYFMEQYGIKTATKIDLPVRVHDLYPNDVEKRRNSLIFTSVPDRGLRYMREAWNTIKDRVPDASLTITSDYRLWGLEEPRNDKFRRDWIGAKDVSFLGAVPRKRLIKEQLSADIYAYPNIYDELFCVSLAEAQVCGAYPVTSEMGALKTTNMGTLISGNPGDDRTKFKMTFCDEIEMLLTELNLKAEQDRVRKKAIKRFHPDNILKQWEKKVFS